MKKSINVLMLFFLTTVLLNKAKAQASNKASKTQLNAGAEMHEASKKINALMNNVSLLPRTNATTDDKKLLKQYEKIRKLSIKVEAAGKASSDLGQQLQLACQEANNITKLRKTGTITLFPNDCYDQCDDQVGSGAAWNEFFCVFKCFKAAIPNLD
jgi:hypothetical protein